MSITENTLLEAIRDALQTSEEGEEGVLTTPELSDLLGQGPRVVRKTLRELIDSGAVEATKATRANIAGYTQRLPAYRLKAKDQEWE